MESSAKTLELCKPCAMQIGESNLKISAQSIDRKITCAKCGRRRFGAEYIVPDKLLAEVLKK